MSLASIWHDIKTWLGKAFISVKDSADVVAIAVTEKIKTAIQSNAATFIVDLIDSIAKTNIGEEALTLLKKYIPEVLAMELAIQGLPDNPTEADIIAFENRILAAFAVTDNKSKLYTTLAAQIYGILQNTINNTPGKFADWVTAVEQAYLDYIADKATTEVE